VPTRRTPAQRRGRGNKVKGKGGEREWAIKTLGTRIWQHLHDVRGRGFYWEVKRGKTGYTKVYDALEEHALHYRESGDGPVPAVAIRQDNKEWIVVFYADDWLAGRGNADTNGKPAG
jgi:hypothetical protein